MTIKWSHQIPVSREMLINAGVIEPTPEEQAERDRTMARIAAAQAAHRAEVEAFLGRLYGAAARESAMALVILSEHMVEDGECQSDDCCRIDQSGDGIPEDAPCLAHRVLARMLGVELP